MSHQTKALILSCLDPLVRPKVCAHYDRELGPENYDLISVAGSAKNLAEETSSKTFVAEQIKAARKLHHFRKVILINHSDCGAYKLAGVSFGEDKEKEKKFHREEMESAAEILNAELPGVEVEIRYFNKEKGEFEF